MINIKEQTPRWIIFVIDVAISLFAVILAFFLRFNFVLPERYTSDFYFLIILFPSVRALSFIISKIYAGIIRYTGTKDAERIFIVNTITSLIFVAINGATYFYNKTFYIPFSILIIEYILTVFLMTSFRIFVKVLYSEIMNANKEKLNVLIYGSSELAITTKRTLEQDGDTQYEVIGFLNEKGINKGQKLEGIWIYDDSKLESLIKKFKIDILIFAKQEVNTKKKNEITEVCLKNNIKVLSIPETKKWIDGELSVKQIKNIKIEELLERPEINLDKENIKNNIFGKTVMITGAAGSIGSEIVKQVSIFEPKVIVLFDQAESELYELELEINELFKTTEYKIIIGDITNKDRVEYIIDRYKPEIIFHAAAYKHVPMMENNPAEAIKTNVSGTKIMADLANKYNVSRFVMVSTDKAVNPTNVMGASKRIAEIYVQSLSKNSNTKYITTRFGNVLGSNGSVIPLFRRQIEAGGPITVTHKDITRFFMTIPEACQLVLEAGTMGTGGEIFVFDMGKSVKIADLAKKMIKLSGLKLNEDIKIKYTGLRPGEKLYEELLNVAEDTVATHHSKIMIGKVREYKFDEVSKNINELIEQNKEFDNYKTVALMKKIVPEFISMNSIFEKLD